MRNYGQIFITALQLGLTSFGGPTAHIGYFYNMYVKRKNWLTDEQFMNIVALSQFLPGPASSQVGIATSYRMLGIVAGFLLYT